MNKSDLILSGLVKKTQNRPESTSRDEAQIQVYRLEGGPAQMGE